MSDGLLKPRPFCSVCRLEFTLAEGEFTGGTYINYGVTGVLFILGFVLLEHTLRLDLEVEFLIWAPFAVVFPFLFQRHAIGLFTAILYATGALDTRPE